MKTVTSCAIATLLGSLAATPAFADHNSPMGAGWANMPNDIHNTRIDTRLADDYQSFIDFVKYGMGADTVNRYLTDTTTTVGQAASGSSHATLSSGTLTSGTLTSSAIDPRMGGRR
jgi:hypothetical protein